MLCCFGGSLYLTTLDSYDQTLPYIRRYTYIYMCISIYHSPTPSKQASKQGSTPSCEPWHGETGAIGLFVGRRGEHCSEKSRWPAPGASCVKRQLAARNILYGKHKIHQATIVVITLMSSWVSHIQNLLLFLGFL